MEWVREKLAEATAVSYDEADGLAKNLVQDIFAILDHRDQIRAVEFLRDRSVDFNWITAIDSAANPRAFVSGSEI